LPTSASEPATTYGNVGGTPFSVTTYDPYYAAALSARTDAQTGAAMANVNSELDATLSRIHDSTLQTTTVQPGMAYGGNVFVTPPRNLGAAKGPVVVDVTVNVGGDVHAFKFTLSRG
jgi:hypothetical protein